MEHVISIGKAIWEIAGYANIANYVRWKNVPFINIVYCRQ